MVTRVNPQIELSAGGLVLKNNPVKILMVRVKNLQGRKVWTFPKGHLEKGENAVQAALREVREETGWKCRIPPRHLSPLLKIQYFFTRGKIKILKRVTWFLMEPLKKSGSRDPEEILSTRWTPFSLAVSRVEYPSDKKILTVLQSIFPNLIP